MTENFLNSIMSVINEVMTVYYEEAANDATFPYGVIPTLNITPLDYGYHCVFDIELYINELSEQSIEEICDLLRNKLDGYSYYENGFGYHIGFDSQYLSSSNDIDLSYRRITFAANIF